MISRRSAASSAAFAWLLLGAIVYRDVWDQLLQQWRSNPSYSHGWLVPPLAAWLLWCRRATCPATGRPWWPGIAAVVAAHGALWIGAEWHLPALQRWSLPVWIAGWIGVVAGQSRLRWAAPAIGFLAFMIPLPFHLETASNQALQSASAWLASRLLVWGGVFAVADPHTLTLPGASVQITSACSGMRLSMAIAAFCFFLAAMRGGGGGRLALTASLVVPSAVLANATRIALLAAAVDLGAPGGVTDWTHTTGDWVAVPFAVLLLLLVSRWLRESTSRLRDRLDTWMTRRDDLGPDGSGRPLDMASFVAGGCRVLLVPVVLVTFGVATTWRYESRQRSLYEQGLDQAERLCESGRLAASSDTYERLLRLFPDSVELRYRWAASRDRLPSAAEDQAASLLRYAAILERAPYHAATLERYLEKCLTLGLSRPALAAAGRLYSVRRDDPHASQIHAEALIRFGGGIAQRPPVRADAIARLLDRVEGKAICRDTFLLACADFASDDPESLDETTRVRLASRLPAAVAATDTADAHFTDWRFRRRFDMPDADVALSRAVTRSRAGIAGPTTPLKIYLQAASEARRRGRMADAFRLLTAATLQDQNDVRVSTQWGDWHRSRGDWRGAAIAYQQARIRGGGGDVRLAANLAESLMRIGRPNESLRLIEPIVTWLDRPRSLDRPHPRQSELDELRTRLIGLRAHALAAAGDHASALRWVDRFRAETATAAAERPGEEASRALAIERLRAECETRLGRYADAANTLQRIADQVSNRAEVLTAAAHAWERAGDSGRCLAAYRGAILAGERLDEVWLEYVSGLRRHVGNERAAGEVRWRENRHRANDDFDPSLFAQAWEIVGDSERAIRHYRAAAARDPDRLAALAIAVARDGDVPNALSLVEDPTWDVRPQARAHTAAIVGRTANPISAAERQRIDRIVDAGLRNASDDPRLLVAAAEWRDVRNDDPSAVIELLSRAVAIAPDDRVAVNNLAMRMADRPEHHTTALRQIDRLIETAGPASAFLDTKGWVLLQMDRAVEAVETLTRALESGPSADPVTRLHLAAAYLAAGETDHAADQWRAVDRDRISVTELTASERTAWEDLTRRWRPDDA